MENSFKPTVLAVEPTPALFNFLQLQTKVSLLSQDDYEMYESLFRDSLTLHPNFYTEEMIEFGQLIFNCFKK